MKMKLIWTWKMAIIVAVYLIAVSNPVVLAQEKDTVNQEYKYLYAPLGPKNKVVKIDLRTEKAVTYFNVGTNPHGMTISPDGRYIYTGEMKKMEDNRVLVTNVLTKENVAEIPAGKISHHLAISKDGTYLYVTGEKLWVINTNTRKVIAQIKTGMMPYYVSVGPKEQYIYVTNMKSNTLSVLAFPMGKIVATIPTGPGPSHIAFSPNGDKLYITEAAGETMSVIDLKTRKLVKSIKLGRDPHAIAVTPGGTIFLSTRGDNSVYMINSSSLKIKKKLEIPLADHILVGPEGKKVYVSSRPEKAI